MEITYLEDDDEPTTAVRPRPPQLPQRSPPPPPAGTPVPGGAFGASWYVCATDTCSHRGYVATGGNPEELVHQITWGRCRACGGLGIDTDTDGNICEPCNGKGRVKLKERDDPPVVACPYCLQQMLFMQTGMQPQGYPRMETPHSDKDPDARGEASMGRTRRIE